MAGYTVSVQLLDTMSGIWPEVEFESLICIEDRSTLMCAGGKDLPTKLALTDEIAPQSAAQIVMYPNERILEGEVA